MAGEVSSVAMFFLQMQLLWIPMHIRTHKNSVYKCNQCNIKVVKIFKNVGQVKTWSNQSNQTTLRNKIWLQSMWLSGNQKI